MLRRLAKFLLRLGGWTSVIGHPNIPKAVVIAAPHTSNWDGVWGIIYTIAHDIDIHFFAKHSLFWFPMNVLLRSLGGLSLDRSAPGSAIQKAVAEFENNDSYFFGLAPEGTRKLESGWKSGFYRLALAADVPVILGFLDYRTKRLGLGPTIRLSGDRSEDLARIAEFYADIEGRWPAKASPVVFASGG